ncbi:unnamed protein product [Phaeothamnion confervicola]
MPATPVPALSSYTERLARAKARKAGAKKSSPPAPAAKAVQPLPPPLPSRQAPSAPAAPPRAMPVASSGVVGSDSGSDPLDVGERITEVLTLLTEWHRDGLEGVDKVAALRTALVNAREGMCLETYPEGIPAMPAAAVAAKALARPTAVPAAPPSPAAEVVAAAAAAVAAAAAPAVPAAPALRAPSIPAQQQQRAEGVGVATALGVNIGGDGSKTEDAVEAAREALEQRLRSCPGNTAGAATLGSTLLAASEALRAETFGAGAAPSSSARRMPAAAASSARPAAAVPAMPVLVGEQALRRCNALLMARLQGDISGAELTALRDALVASLAAVELELTGAVAVPAAAVAAVEAVAPAAVAAAIAPAAPAKVAGKSAASPPKKRTGDSISAQVARGEAAIHARGPPPRAPKAAAGAPARPKDGPAGMQSVGAVLNEMGFKGDGGDDGAENSASPFGAGGARQQEFRAAAQKALGYLIKHRGGAGWGRGRLRDPEVAEMEAAISEVRGLMKEDADYHQP